LKGRLLSGGRIISLTKGKVAIVDEEDFCSVSKHNWHVMWKKSTKSYYAVRREYEVGGRKKIEYMHRFILKLKYGNKTQVDHENHNTTDNRKRNLKLVNHRGNQENRIDQSKYGVGIHKQRKRFRLKFVLEGERRHFGMFDTPEEATKVRNKILEEINNGS